MKNVKYVAGAFVAGGLAAGAIASANDGGIVGRTGGKEAASRPATVPKLPLRPLATVSGSEEGTSLSLMQLRRTGPKVVTATLRVSSTRDEYFGWTPDLAGEDGEWGTAEGLRLVDEVNGREHLPLQTPDGECLCSDAIENIPKGEDIGVYAKFAAPPAGVDRASLHVPGFQSIDDIPLVP
jgi:hypothetical protein